MAEETRQQRRARERREGVIRDPTSASPPTGEKKSIRAWQIAVGIPMGFVAVGLATLAMGPANFTVGACLAYAGIGWLLFDWWFFSKELSTRFRLVGTLGTLIIAAALIWVVFRPATLNANAFAFSSNYETGVKIAGIKWTSDYSDNRIVADNESSFQYTNLDFIV
jgi:hypothetical protein